MIICKCFAVTYSQVSNTLESFHSASHQNSPLEFLKKHFPFLTHCQDCAPELRNLINESLPSRKSFWQNRPNTYWEKKIHFACKQKAELVDFFNGKVFMSCDSKNKEVIEKIIHDEFTEEIKVVFI
jgi:bacterioferritin-associated ferredoxin